MTSQYDPHIEALHFDIGTDGNTSYSNPPALSFTNAVGRFEASSGKLVVQPQQHFDNQQDALAVIEPFLRSWEMESDLTAGVGVIRFTFKSADVVERNPPPPGRPRSIRLSATVSVTASLTATAHIVKAAYPAPPQTFQISPDVETAYARWRNMRAGREPLQSMAYFLVTMIEALAGGRKEAASAFNVELKVLATMARVSSTKGDATSARKFIGHQPSNALAGNEGAWLEVAVRRVIRRLGEHASGSPGPRITMDDLPPL